MMTTMLHLSIPIHDTKQAERFYGDILGCRITRRQSDRLDIDFFGHHLVGQLSVEESSHRSVDIGKDQYPLRHFGVIVQQPVYDQLLESLTQAKVPFAMQPTQIFTGTMREQSVFLVLDPSGNALEVKGLPEPDRVFSPK
jgi:extradiol dioxygenase family protein